MKLNEIKVKLVYFLLSPFVGLMIGVCKLSKMGCYVIIGDQEFVDKATIEAAKECFGRVRKTELLYDQLLEAVMAYKEKYPKDS